MILTARPRKKVVFLLSEITGALWLKLGDLHLQGHSKSQKYHVQQLKHTSLERLHGCRAARNISR